ncbi:MAG TPA: hypothetical protein VEF04_01110, partial [Blastocatellia bacterium]|nr:hypothetical protein [Blastocatellia bacterium]
VQRQTSSTVESSRRNIFAILTSKMRSITADEIAESIDRERLGDERYNEILAALAEKTYSTDLSVSADFMKSMIDRYVQKRRANFQVSKPIALKLFKEFKNAITQPLVGNRLFSHEIALFAAFMFTNQREMWLKRPCANDAVMAFEFDQIHPALIDIFGTIPESQLLQQYKCSCDLHQVSIHDIPRAFRKYDGMPHADGSIEYLQDLMRAQGSYLICVMRNWDRYRTSTPFFMADYLGKSAGLFDSEKESVVRLYHLAVFASYLVNDEAFKFVNDVLGLKPLAAQGAKGKKEECVAFSNVNENDF